MTRAFVLLALAGALASCNRNDGPPEIAITDAWARPTVAGQDTAAAYVTIANGGGEDRLVSASTPAAGGATLHSTRTSNGVSRMRPLADGLPVPAGETVRLEPSGTHIMLTALRSPLPKGGSFELRLRFERSGEKLVTVRVTNASASGGHEGH